MVQDVESALKPSDLAEPALDPSEESKLAAASLQTNLKSKGDNKAGDLESESKHKPTKTTNASAEKPKNDKEKIIKEN